jgi:hypothetical protein
LRSIKDAGYRPRSCVVEIQSADDLAVGVAPRIILSKIMGRCEAAPLNFATREARQMINFGAGAISFDEGVAAR